MKFKKILLTLFIVLGIIDAGYLTFEHYRQVIPPCTINRFLPILSDCGKVLRSSYSVMFGIPLAVLGVTQYIFLLLIIVFLFKYKKRIFIYWLILQSMVGAIFSLYFVYLQLVILKSICIYCMFSALISFAIFFLVSKIFYKERFSLRLNIIAFIYQKIIKPIFFLLDAEFVHLSHVFLGELLGKTFIKNYINWKFNYSSLKLRQKVAEINFTGPVGLAAGFDYEARLTQILYSLGFGFQSVGTITNLSYKGNPKPRLGRLPKSRSLMVYKGFKNEGATTIVNRIQSLEYKIPMGISVGMSNNLSIKNTSDAVKDVVAAFKTCEKSKTKNKYYELNISCPNLINTAADFYEPANLSLLLNSISRLKIKKPIFVKMPISITNKEFLSLLSIISQFKIIKGVIIGNLLKDRKNSLLNKQEVKKFKVGNFSGKPCEPRSNELIKLTYKKYGNRLVIVGCGGVFNGQDAYKKIKLGASLIQMITGMIYQGPQVISQINIELEELLEKDGFKNINDAIGYENH
ncbi:MAG: quinone-dependent dihydroorotate dehydrogenase [Patescibacteria group bacterium]|jgi:dihydroorotate dehydrogenase subfamily 2